jgi:hypothetical protein
MHVQSMRTGLQSMRMGGASAAGVWVAVLLGRAALWLATGCPLSWHGTGTDVFRLWCITWGQVGLSVILISCDSEWTV